MADSQPVTSRCATSHSPSAAPTAEGQRSRYLETRNKALELFAMRGFSQVSMRDLATYIGINAGSLYNHIDSKEGLLFELIEELYEQLLHGARLVNRRKPAPDVRLHSLLETHLLLHERMGAHFRLAEYDLRNLSSEQHASILTLRRRYEEHFVESIEQLTGEPANAIRRAALSSIISLLNQLPAWIEEPQSSRKIRRKVQHDMVMSTLHGALEATHRSQFSTADSSPRVSRT